MRIYESEAEVLIWPYHGMKSPGHAALKIRTNKDGEVYQTYVSWWPAGGEGKNTPFSYRPAEAQPGYYKDKFLEMSASTRNRLNDGEINRDPRRFQKVSQNPNTALEFVTSANKKFNLPGLFSRVGRTRKSGAGIDGFDNVAGRSSLADGEYTYWGLNLPGMVKWWMDFSDTPKGYSFVSTKYNCAAVVAQCLLEGCADAYIDIKQPKMYYTPNDISALADKLVNRLDDLNIESRRLINNSRQSLDRPGIWTSEEFYKASYAGRFARRKGQVASIDDLLKEYHKAGPWDENNFPQKFKALGRMMRNVLDHRQKKAGSDRGGAVETLGLQILAELSSEELLIAQNNNAGGSLAALLSLCEEGNNRTLDQSFKKAKKF
ncbi:hypothetical protein Dthio_PD2078 [Desulfonatronospira thiodismutans ASO3-1]|uniref:Uncharacterized protein n=1 Tax=Desulfonatronospira thiodismutans ASO3-1 TaxID=555779 RepID=D6SPN0_9BACT|nr:hypothetical protein [Desulfonatronospira thiodismutans]EFI34706.1 hypothetical protein Dthio_PD2078 [Desulfonatronospira thiodismutans ASO3-1]